MLAKDSESQGLDHQHSARPFFFSTCDEEGNQCWWEAEVDPLTRCVKWDAQELRQYEEYCNKHERWIYQNAKFDIHMECAIGVRHPHDVWSRIEDTVVAGHLLSSNTPHDLTAMAKQYLGVDIKPLEEALEQAVKDCRHIVQQARLRLRRLAEKQRKPPLITNRYNPRNPPQSQLIAFSQEKEWLRVHAPLAKWKICDEGMPGFPSAKGKDVWRGDYWLPKAMAKWFRKPADHPWHTVLQEYANADTEITMALWKVQEQRIRDRGLWAIYRKQMELTPILYDMERRGVTVCAETLDRMTIDYTSDSQRLETQCETIASRYTVTTTDGSRTPYQLTLPDNGVNESLRVFLTDILKVPPIYNPKAKTDAPTLNKDALEYYQNTLDQGSIEHLFVRSLLDKRQIDTALGFMDAYRKYGRTLAEIEGCLLLNPSYKQTGTATTRLSSYSPNAQQISKKSRFNLRRCFGPAEGREWWSLDAANIELRLPAYESGEQDLIDLFEKANEPPYYGSEHILNFSVVYPDIWDSVVRKVGLANAAEYIKNDPEMKSTWYRRCKNGDFAIQFGAINRVNGMGTADRAFGRPGSHNRLEQRFSKKQALNQKWIAYANQHGYVETMPDRTVDPDKGYPLLCTRTSVGNILPTVPLSYHVQGTAGVWMKHGMIRVQPQLDEWYKASAGRWYGRMVMTVHDELVFDLPRMAHPKRNPKASNLWRIRVIQKILEQGGQYLVPSVPTKVSVSYHQSNWAEEETL